MPGAHDPRINPAGPCLMDKQAIPRRSGRTILHLPRLPLRGGREVQGRECDAIRGLTSLLAIAAEI
jgi:hypothetical protein